MKHYLIEKLDKRRHDRENFDCGIDVLNVYLQMRANQEQKKRLNVTHVAVPAQQHRGKKSIVGYYTLSNSAICPSLMATDLKKGIPTTYAIPTVKIGRLAVDVCYHSMGVGSYLLKDACKNIVEVSTLSGIKGVEVIAKNEKAVGFYERFGFIRLLDAKNLLFLPIETLHNNS